MRKKLGFMVLAALVTFVGAGQSASAQGGGGTYPPSPDPTTVWVDKPTVKIGESLVISAKGLCTGAPATFEFAPDLGSAGQVVSGPITVASDGKASFSLRVPGPAGSYLAWVKQPACNIKLSAAVTVKDAVSDNPTLTPTAPVPTVSATKASASLPIVVSASNLCPSEDATFTLVKGSTTVATTTQMVLANGTTTATLAAQPAGDYTLTITQACGTNSSSALRVESLSPVPAPASPAAPTAAPAAPTAAPTQATPTAGGAQLPTTGADSLPALQLALVALLTGAGLTVVSIKRRSRMTPIG